MPAIFCPACSSLLLAVTCGSGPRVHCQRCGEVITLAGLGAELPVRSAPRLITDEMLRDWQDRFPFALEPFAADDGPGAF